MKTMENKNESETLSRGNVSKDKGTQQPKAVSSPVSVGAIIAALIAGYALGYFPPKRVAAEPSSSSPSVTVPAPAVAPAAPAQRAPAPSGGGCGV